MYKNNTMKTTTIISLALSLLAAAPAAWALTVTPNSLASDLAGAITTSGGGLNVISASLSGHTTVGGASSGTFTNETGTYGIGAGIVLTSGDVAQYGDGLNQSTASTKAYNVAASAAQEALLDPISGGSFNHHDVTQLDIGFTSTTGEVHFQVVFGSEEYGEFVGSQFVDAFGIYLDGVNIAQTGGNPLNINHPAMSFHPGTELDGLLAPGGDPLLIFSRDGLNAGPHTLTFIIADTSDAKWDSTVYLAGLSAAPPVPVPAAVWLFGSGLAWFAGLARRKAAQT